MLSQITVKVCNKSNQLVVDSRLIAESLGIKHRTLLSTINKYQSEIEEDWGTIVFEIASSIMPNGSFNPNPEKFAYLNEQQSTLLMTYSRNTEQVRLCKRNLVKSFEYAKELLKSAQPQKAPAKIINPQYLPGRKQALDKLKEHGAKGWVYGAVESYNNALVGIENGKRHEVDELQAYKLMANYYAMRDELDNRVVGFAKHQGHLKNTCTMSMRHGIYALAGVNAVSEALKPIKERRLLK